MVDIQYIKMICGLSESQNLRLQHLLISLCGGKLMNIVAPKVLSCLYIGLYSCQKYLHDLILRFLDLGIQFDTSCHFSQAYGYSLKETVK